MPLTLARHCSIVTASDGPVVGRIYKLSAAPTWAVQLFPAVAADSGTAETREAAMAEFKAQW
jgi:hypothetical protein